MSWPMSAGAAIFNISRLSFDPMWRGVGMVAKVRGMTTPPSARHQVPALLTVSTIEAAQPAVQRRLPPRPPQAVGCSNVVRAAAVDTHRQTAASPQPGPVGQPRGRPRMRTWAVREEGKEEDQGAGAHGLLTAWGSAACRRAFVPCRCL